jgi:6-phosphogluconolactonase/glucosamine-6-phosphate isomerase/deaminase
LKISIKQHELLAQQAAQSVEKHITGAINSKGVAHIILATGSSQLLFLKH